MSIRIALSTLVVSASFLGALTATVRAQEPLKAIGRRCSMASTRPAQARRGQEQFEEHCASCHRQDLGGIAGPALKGDRFLDQWREFPLEVLVNDMASQMPLRNPGALPPGTYVDIAAYLLEANGLPAGQTRTDQGRCGQGAVRGAGGPQAAAHQFSRA